MSMPAPVRMPRKERLPAVIWGEGRRYESLLVVDLDSFAVGWTRMMPRGCYGPLAQRLIWVDMSKEQLFTHNRVKTPLITLFLIASRKKRGSATTFLTVSVSAIHPWTFPACRTGVCLLGGHQEQTSPADRGGQGRLHGTGRLTDMVLEISQRLFRDEGR